MRAWIPGGLLLSLSLMDSNPTMKAPRLPNLFNAVG